MAVIIGMDPHKSSATIEINRQQARDDLRYWDAKVVVMADMVSGAHWTPHYAELRRVMVELRGEPERVDDVWLWRV